MSLTTNGSTRLTATRLRRFTAAALAAMAIGGAGVTAAAGVAAADPPAPSHSRGYAVGPFSHQGCLNAAAHNAAYFHSHGGGGWNYTCWSTRSGWFYTSPYAA